MSQSTPETTDRGARHAVFERVRTLLVESEGIEQAEIVPAACLRDDLGLDSLSIVELQMQVEETFGIDFPDERVTDTITVGEVVDIIQADLASRAAVAH